MTLILAATLAAALAALAFGYVGYPLMIRYGPRRLWRIPEPTQEAIRRCVVVCAAHNEAAVIGRMIGGALAAVGPEDSVIVASDGSTDGTDLVVNEWSALDKRVRLIRLSERGGKNRALNAALVIARSQPDTAVVFTDANAVLQPNAVALLVTRLEAGATCVVGRVEFINAASDTARSEGLYWRYEDAIKRAESGLGRVLVANGAIFAVRAVDCATLPDDTGNDLYLPLSILGRGRQVEFEPRAIAREPAALRRDEEFARKRRMATRQMQGFWTLWPGLDWSTRAQFISHKILRWLGLPAVGIAFVSAVGLGRVHWVFLMIAAVLALPFAAAAVQSAGLQTRVGALGGHFVVVQWAALLGLADFARGRRRTVWASADTARPME